MSKTAKQQEKNLFEIVEAGMIANAAQNLLDMLEETTLLTQEEKAPSRATITALVTPLAARTKPAYNALIAKKGAVS